MAKIERKAKLLKDFDAKILEVNQACASGTNADVEKRLKGVKFLSQEENEAKRPLEQVLDDAIKNALMELDSEERTVNQQQLFVLSEVYATLTEMFGAKSQVRLYPSFCAGCVIVKVDAVELNADEISTLQNAFEKCAAVSIDPLVSGEVEIGVTVPYVYLPKS